MSRLSVALVVTVKDETSAFSQLLSDIEQQSQLPDQVVFTITHSSREAFARLKKWNPQGIEVIVKDIGSATRSVGRNVGVELSTADVAVFTDVGCRLDKQWIKELIAPLADSKIKLVSGLTLVDARNAWDEAQGAFVLVAPEKIGEHPLPATRNAAIRREAFIKSDGFKSSLNYAEDFEWSRRLARKGIQSFFAPQAKVFWKPRSSSSAFWIMILRLSAGDMQAHQWRRGHLTMWLRYLLFLSFVISLASFVSQPSIVILMSLLVYVTYISSKLSRFSFTRAGSYLWAAWFQVLADTAVLCGTAIGLASNLKRRDNKLHD